MDNKTISLTIIINSNSRIELIKVPTNLTIRQIKSGMLNKYYVTIKDNYDLFIQHSTHLARSKLEDDYTLSRVISEYIVGRTIISLNLYLMDSSPTILHNEKYNRGYREKYIYCAPAYELAQINKLAFKYCCKCHLKNKLSSKFCRGRKCNGNKFRYPACTQAQLLIFKRAEETGKFMPKIVKDHHHFFSKHNTVSAKRAGFTRKEKWLMKTWEARYGTPWPLSR